MVRFYSILFLVILVFSCKEKKSVDQQISDVIEDTLVVEKPDASQKIIQFSPEFIEENKINEWKDFKKFKDAIEDITQLNPAGVMIFISELYKTTSALLKAPFPEAFDKFPVYGRIKVVQTQIIKCHFYAYNKQNEKLNVALNELYVEYNILLKRMISIAEENKIQLDSLGLDTPTIQDSKTIPAFSKK